MAEFPVASVMERVPTRRAGYIAEQRTGIFREPGTVLDVKKT
jgi:hypothetical protein